MTDIQRELELDTVTVVHRRELVATIVRAGADDEARTVPVTISTENAVSGPSGMPERLPHTAEAVDLSRAERGLPLQVAHRSGELPVGRVEQVRIEGGRLRGLARFGNSVRAREAWADVRDGIISDVSVGAMVRAEDWIEEGGTLTARRWQPVEVSLVSVGADPGAGINRGHMMDTPNRAAPAADSGAERAEQIAALFAGLEGERWLKMERDALRAGDSIEQVRERVLVALKEGAAPTVKRDTPDTTIRAGADGMEKWIGAAEAALTYRMQLDRSVSTSERAAAVRDNELAGMTLRELARDYLRARGERTAGLSAEQLVDKALRVPAVLRTQFSHSTSDFANILGSSAEKALSTGYEEAPETFRTWTRNVTMSNFRQHSFTNLSLFGDLQQVRPGEEYTAGTFSDRVNTATLATYGKLFTITRQAIVNDDLNAFTDIPRRMGRASARQVGDLVYAVLTGNVKLSEQAGSTLFNTTDGNLASSGGAISTTTLDTARAAMRTRTDPSGATLNIMPRYLLVPAAKETTARVQMVSEKDPAEGTTTSFDAANPFRNAFDVVAEPRLDANSTTAWYLLASPGAEVDTVIVGWLNGRQEPFLEQEEGFTVDGVRYKVRIDCTAAALDWRGMYKNAGA